MLIRVPESRLSALDATIQKWNRKAQALGLPEVTTHYVAYSLAYRFTVSGRSEYLPAYCWIEISAPRPVLPGFEFLGAIQHTDAGNVLRAVPGRTIPEHFRVGAPVCNHCHTRRRRKDSYVLSDSEGRVIQIGRACMRDFLPGVDLKAIEFYFNIERQAGEASAMLCANALPEFSADAVLQLAACAVRIHGYGKGTTAGRVAANMLPPALRGKDFEANDRLIVTPADEDKAQRVFEWARKQRGSSYFLNLRVLLTATMSFVAGDRNLRLLVSAVAAFDRAHSAPKPEETRRPSEWVGEVKKRIDFVLTLRSERFFETQFGCRALYTFEDAHGNVCVWWTNASQRLAVGDTYAVRATVKEQTTYRDKKQTVLTRCLCSKKEAL